MKIANNKNLNTSGFTLIEVLAAVAVLSIGLLGGLSAITKNLSGIYAGENRIIAGSLAEDGMERVRNIRDTNWLQGRTDEEGNAAWDKDISGKSVNYEDYIRVFCGDNSLIKGIHPTPGGDDEKARIDNCADNGNCKLYIYTKDSLKCYGDDLGTSRDGYTGSAYAGFYRMIHITEDLANSNRIKVDITVRWTEGGQNKYLTVSETLYNWK